MTDARARLDERLSALDPARRAQLAARIRRGGDAEARPAVLDGSPGPATLAQERLWLVERRFGTGRGYSTPLALRLRGALDADRLERALAVLAVRHDALRTRLVERDGALWQELLDAVPPLERADIEPEALASELSARAARPFDLERGPLFRSSLLRLGPREHVLSCDFHHAVIDGASIGILLRELERLYADPDGALPAPRATLRDAARWERARQASPAGAAALAAVRARLASLAIQEPLLFDRPRGGAPSFRGGRVPLSLPAPLVRELGRVASASGASRFMAIAAALAAILARETDRDTVAIGAPVSARSRSELADTVGFLVDTVVVPLTIDPVARVESLFAAAREACLAAFSTAEVPFDRVVRELAIDPARTIHPLFSVMLSVQDDPLPLPALDGLDVEELEVAHGGALFDLLVVLRRDDGEGLRGYLEHDLDVIDDRTARRIAADLRAALEDAVRDPRGPARMLGTASRTRAVVTGPPRLEARALRLGDGGRASERIAVEGSRSVTHAELHARIDGIASAILVAGVRPGDRVAVALARDVELVAALHGVLRAGAVLVPIDPEHPRARIAQIVEDTAPSLVLLDASTADLAPALPTLRLDTPLAPGPRPPSIAFDGAAPAYVLHTSGSGGRPKGVVVPHGAARACLDALCDRLAIGPDDVWLATTSVGFDVSLLELFLPAEVGARIRVVDRATVRDGHAISALARDATILQATPSTYRLWLAEGFRPHGGLTVLSGGEALTSELASRLGEGARRLFNLYGPTEATIWCSAAELGAGGGRGRIGIGAPLAGTTLGIVDGDVVLPTGVTGELVISGPQLALGYLGDPSLTAARFTQIDGVRAYRTGDRARLSEDGTLELLGRVDRQLKIRGVRVEPGEIEAALTALEGVAEAAVVPVHVGDDVELVACAVARTAHEHASEREARLRARWREVWQAVWSTPRDAVAPIDLRGWVSRTSGAVFDASEMSAWVARTAADIAALGPRRVLEVGAGAGLLTERCAPACETWDAIDVGADAVRALAARCQGAPHLRHVRVLEREASELDGLEGPYDLVILASVAQYLPSEAYLGGLLEALEPRVAPGGAILLGDLRTLEHLPALHLELALATADPSLDAAALATRVEHSVQREIELALSPRLALAGRLPRLRSIDRWLAHPGPSELSRFRFEAWLQFDVDRALPAREVRLGDDGSRALPAVIRDVENAAVASVLGALAAAREGRLASAGEARALVRAAVAGVPPLPELADVCGAEVRVAWPRSGRPERVDLWLLPPGAGPIAGGPVHVDGDGPSANDPLAAAARAGLAERWMQELSTQLPAAAMPSRIDVVRALPRTPNGKLDLRLLSRALAPRTATRSAATEALETPTERRVAEMMRAICGVDRVGRADSFFALGGHSLSAIELAARVRAELGVTLRLRRIFEAPTVSAIAAAIDAGSSPDAGATADGAGTAVPATAAQQRLVFLDRLVPGRAGYTVPLGIAIRGELDEARLSLALASLLARHDGLRATLSIRGEGVVLSPDGVRSIELERVEPTALRAWLARPFDLERGPLVRAALVRREGDLLLALDAHHAVTDGWSSGVLVRELGALLEGRTLAPAPSWLAHARREGREPPDRAARVDAAVDALRGLPETTSFPLDRPRPLRADFVGGRVALAVPLELRQAVERLARAESTTPFAILLAALGALLHRLGGAEDLAIGTPTSRRDDPDTHGLVGPMASTLVLRLDATAAPSFRELVRRAHAVVTRAHGADDVPFEELVRALRPGRNLASNPLFQVLLALSAAPMPRVCAGETELAVEPLDNGACPFDASLFLWEHEGGWRGTIEYATAIFDRGSAERWAEQLVRLLGSGTVTPDLGIAELDLGPTSFVVEAGDAARTSIAARIAALPAEPIVVEADDGVLTRGEVVLRARAVAGRLRDAGVVPGDRVAVVLEPSLATIPSLLGCWYAGAAFAPLDPAAPQARIADQLAVLGARAAIARRPLGALPTIDPDDAVERGELGATGVEADRLDEVAYVLFTSGSTGTPKAVEAEHRALATCLDAFAARLALGPHDRVLALTDTTFDVAQLELWLPLLSGARAFVVPRCDAVDGVRLRARVESIAPTLIQTTPSRFRLLLAAGWDGDAGCTLLSGGEPLTPELAASLRARGRRLWNVYGPTEATLWCSVDEVNETSPVTIGRPLPGTDCTIVDARGRPVPWGAVGELWIGGAQLARGYLGSPERTAARFVAHPIRPDARAYRSGDRARLRADGRLEHLGRLDDQLKIRGVRTEPEEVERALGALSGVREAAVAGRPGPDAELRLVAWVVPDRDVLREVARSTRHAERVRCWDEVHRRDPEAAAAFSLDGDESDPDRTLVGPWADEVASLVRSLAPRTVLELGIGSGSIARRCVGVEGSSVERWIGVDASAVPLASLPPGIERVHADALEALAHAPEVDLVLVDGLATFLEPDELAALLGAALGVVGDDGAVLVTGLRDPDVVRARLAERVLATADPAEPPAATARRLSSAVSRDPSLAVSAGWIHRVAAGVGAGSVALAVARTEHPAAPDVPTFHALLRTAASGRTPTIVGIGVDRRAARGLAVAAGIERGAAVADLRALVAGADALDVAAMRRRAAQRAEGPKASMLVAIPGEAGTVRLVQAEEPLVPERPDPHAAAKLHAPAPPTGAWLAALRAGLAARLPAAMVPSAFVIVESLPRSVAGKVDRRALPDPPREARAEAVRHVSPRDELERTLADIVAEVLGVERVGAEDDFFALGGASIAALRVAARARAAGLAVTPERVFEHPVIADLARAIRGDEP